MSGLLFVPFPRAKCPLRPQKHCELKAQLSTCFRRGAAAAAAATDDDDDDGRVNSGTCSRDVHRRNWYAGVAVAADV